MLLPNPLTQRTQVVAAQRIDKAKVAIREYSPDNIQRILAKGNAIVHAERKRRYMRLQSVCYRQIDHKSSFDNSHNETSKWWLSGVSSNITQTRLNSIKVTNSIKETRKGRSSWWALKDLRLLILAETMTGKCSKGIHDSVWGVYMKFQQARREHVHFWTPGQSELQVELRWLSIESAFLILLMTWYNEE